MNPKEVYKLLVKEPQFLNWKNENKNSFLSHFFVQVDSKLETKSAWQIGFFNTDTKKITVFEDENGFVLKPADDVFKKETDQVEKLNLESVELNFNQAKEKYQLQWPKAFPNEDIGDGFLILQTLKDVTMWNFTFITKTIKFANLKINATSGEKIDHQIVELVQK